MNLYLMYQREIAEKSAIYKNTITPCISNNGFSKDLPTSIITLGVKDLERAVIFYELEMGWKKLKTTCEQTALFKLNGMVLRLYPYQQLSVDTGLDFEKRPYSGIVLSYPARDEKEVDTIFKQLHCTSAEIVKNPCWTSYEEYAGYFTDRDGHMWQVVYNLYYPVEEIQKFYQ